MLEPFKPGQLTLSTEDAHFRRFARYEFSSKPELFLKEGEVFMILEKMSYEYRVIWQGQIGYVSARHMKFDE